MKDFVNVFKSSLLAGCAIGLGGYVYLTVGGIIGAVLFSFGLLTVVNYSLHLFTGKSGYFSDLKELMILFTAILIGNVCGCYLMSLIANEHIVAGASAIVAGRLEAGYLTNFLLAIPCGFIMTTSVEFAKRGNSLPLMYGVPLFIMCGFRHSIADAFYYCCAGLYSQELLITWLLIVFGNFIGCNFYRTLINKKNE